MDDKEKKKKEIEEYAKKIMGLARDTVTVRFRFFDTALAHLKPVPKENLGGFATDGKNLFYDPTVLLLTYMEEPSVAVRLYLHVLLHLIFNHRFQYDKLNEHYWNLATDIAVENIILEMDLPSAALTRDGEAKDRIVKLKKWVPSLSAEKLYKEFLVNNPSLDAEREYKRLFVVDLHDTWRKQRNAPAMIISEEQWKKIAERVKTDLKTFSKDKIGSESLENNIDEATRQRYDYRDILQRFTVTGEEIELNDDEFDYIYYTYGLSTYGNMPLVEPLEYRETKKIKDFVIVIDTSASCRGNIVKNFLQKTYDILKESENFFHKVNIHIVQCDARVQSDTVIKEENDFKEFIAKGKLSGFGSTDFRPAFSYVDELLLKGEFENLKGLIYFTDGYGIYPEKMPMYDVIFAFLDEDENRLPVPGWALKVILEEEEFEQDN